MKIWIVTQLWKINYIRHRWCWAYAVGWAFGGDGGFLMRVDPQCDYCGNCKDAEEVTP